MCLLVLAWNVHPRHRVVLTANRDEFHERPAAAMAWWEEPRMLAGRDLKAGGAWLAVDAQARFAVVTNYRDLQPPKAGAPSRGVLIPQFLGANAGAQDYASRVAPEAERYSGFNLLVGDRTHLSYIANRAPERTRELAPGVFGLSNHLLDTPWPKLVRTRQRFERLLAHERIATDDLLAMLTDREPGLDHDLPDGELPPDLERALSAPFIVHERYGTRCSTVLCIGHDGHVAVTEQRYDAGGHTIGRAAFEFQA
jgi:uncharacterized protein with NRDE domain